MGMERIAPTFAEVDVLITMLARSAVGARLTGYNTGLTGPREADNVDGPEEFHLVIVDNGRSQVLGPRVSRCLRCIRCGACMNTCSGVPPHWRTRLWFYLSRPHRRGDFSAARRL